MGLLDKIKRLVRSHKSEVASGIDEVADLAGKELGARHEANEAADVIKDQLDVEPQHKRGRKRP